MFAAQRIKALGAMSGTSLDGVDAAVIDTDGEQIFGFGDVAFRAYTADERTQLRAAFGQWDGDVLEPAAEIVETAHAEVLSQFDDVDLIGFHGQTVAHEPKGRGTLQIGDGAVLAEVLGQAVVWDFRSSDVQMGGEGAPLVPFFHYALAKYLGVTAPFVFLNIGGVANLTWVDPTQDRPDHPQALLAMDTGPGNALIDDFVAGRTDQSFDRDGDLAARGDVIDAIVDRFLSRPFFYRMAPKSLDRNEFADLLSDVADLGVEDGVATLTAATVLSIVQGIEQCPQSPQRVIVCGGGRHNATMMAMLSASLDVPVEPIEAYELNGDMIEAYAFGYLAVRVLRGLPTSCPTTTGVRASVSGGIVSRPIDGDPV